MEDADGDNAEEVAAKEQADTVLAEVEQRSGAEPTQSWLLQEAEIAAEKAAASKPATGSGQTLLALSQSLKGATIEEVAECLSGVPPAELQNFETDAALGNLVKAAGLGQSVEEKAAEQRREAEQKAAEEIAAKQEAEKKAEAVREAAEASKKAAAAKAEAEQDVAMKKKAAEDAEKAREQAAKDEETRQVLAERAAAEAAAAKEASKVAARVAFEKNAAADQKPEEEAKSPRINRRASAGEADPDFIDCEAAAYHAESARGGRRAMTSSRQAGMHATLSQLAAFLRESKENSSQEREGSAACEGEIEELKQEGSVWKGEVDRLSEMAEGLQKQLRERAYTPGQAFSPDWQRSRGLA